jgi:hypothetical protein
MTLWLFAENCHLSRSMSSRIWKTLFTLVCTRFDGSYFRTSTRVELKTRTAVRVL